MKYLITFSLFLFCGCNVQRRQMDKLDAYAVKYPIEFKRLSNTLNPCFDGKAKSDTVIKTHTDTLIQDGVTDTVRRKDTLYITKTMPGKVITRTNTITIHDTLENKRLTGVISNDLRLKSDSLLIVKTQLKQVQGTKTKLIWWVGGLAAALALGIYLFFSGGWIKKVI